MPITKKDGTPGLLSKGLFGEATKAIPDHTDKIKNIEDSAVLYGKPLSYLAIFNPLLWIEQLYFVTTHFGPVPIYLNLAT